MFSHREYREHDRRDAQPAGRLDRIDAEHPVDVPHPLAPESVEGVAQDECGKVDPLRRAAPEVLLGDVLSAEEEPGPFPHKWRRTGEEHHHGDEECASHARRRPCLAAPGVDARAKPQPEKESGQEPERLQRIEDPARGDPDRSDLSVEPSCGCDRGDHCHIDKNHECDDLSQPARAWTRATQRDRPFTRGKSGDAERQRKLVHDVVIIGIGRDTENQSGEDGCAPRPSDRFRDCNRL